MLITKCFPRGPLRQRGALQDMVEEAIIKIMYGQTVVTRSIQFTATTIKRVQIADGIQYYPPPKRFKQIIKDEHTVETDEWTAQKYSWGNQTIQDRRMWYKFWPRRARVKKLP